MTSIIETNARDIIDADGDFVGYDLPGADPIDIDTTWVRKWGREDELVYVVTWADGTWAKMFSFTNPSWHGVFWRCSKARYEAGRAKLDATLAAYQNSPLTQGKAA